MADDLDKKVTAIKSLVELFKVERYIYVSVTVLSFLVLIVCAVFLLNAPNKLIVPVIGMFGSSGAIAFTTGRLLKMWSDAIKILINVSDDEKRTWAIKEEF